MHLPEGKIESKSNYKLIRKLGKGSFSEAYLAKQEELGRLVVLKFIKGGKETISLLQNEAWIQGRLNHPNIVPIYGINKELGFIVTEYCEESLEQKYLEKARTPPLYTALKIVTDCLKALAHAHREGVVHGNITPNNIMVDKDNNAKISDFGVAKLWESVLEAELGLSEFAAPETYEKWKKDRVWQTSRQSDLFSLGVIAYYLLTGRHPFSDPSGMGRQLQDLLLDDSFAPPPPVRKEKEIAEGLAKVIMKLIERDPEKRYFLAEQVIQDLELAVPQDILSRNLSRELENKGVEFDSIDGPDTTTYEIEGNVSYTLSFVINGARLEKFQGLDALVGVYLKYHSPSRGVIKHIVVDIALEELRLSEDISKDSKLASYVFEEFRAAITKIITEVLERITSSMETKLQPMAVAP